MAHPPLPSQLQRAIAPWPAPAQSCFAEIRDLVLDATAKCSAAPLLETLKWGEPSWLPTRPHVGSTLRVAWKSQRPKHIGLFVNCRTTLAEDIRTVWPDSFEYEKARALWLPLDAPLPRDAVAHAALMTLTYHLPK